MYKSGLVYCVDVYLLLDSSPDNLVQSCDRLQCFSIQKLQQYLALKVHGVGFTSTSEDILTGNHACLQDMQSQG